MSNEPLQNETEFRRFLLGEMTEQERVALEGNFIIDEALFENLRVAEDELIENYLRGSLSTSEKNKFETNFLTTKKRRERVEFTRQMLDKLKENELAVAEVKKTTLAIKNPSFFESILEIFRQPSFALGATFAIVLLVFGGWFLFRNLDPKIEVVKNNPTPIPSVFVSPTPPIVENNSNTSINTTVNIPNTNTEIINQRPKIESNINKNSSNTNLEKPVQTPNSVVSTLALFTGGVRSDGKTNELKLPKNSGGANLQLNLESNDYKIYKAEIVDQNGNVIFRNAKLSAKGLKINTFVPAKNLKNGDYILKLYGKNAQNEDESVADFQFRVKQD